MVGYAFVKYNTLPIQYWPSSMKLSPRTISILKYLFAFCLLWLVLSKVGLDEIGKHVKEISFGEGIAALIFATAAQVSSAMRMRYFFTKAMFTMSAKFAIVLYYVGAFYNFLLPGGIGGDAYKVMLVRKRMEMSAAQGIRIMVADRASGLCVIMFTFFLGCYLIGLNNVIPYGSVLLILATIITPIVYIIASRKLLKQLPVDMVGSLSYSVTAQFFWIATLYMLWNSIGHGEHFLEYVTLYCAASIASLIPLSPGGLGLRELTYLYGAGLMQTLLARDVNPDVGIAMSLCMFALTFISALPGLLWLNKVNKATIEPIKKTHPLSENHYASTANTSREDWN